MELLRIRELLKEKGISGIELADIVGVTPVSVSNILNGKNFPRPELLLKISQALDVDIRELFNSTKEGYTQLEKLELISKLINEVIEGDKR